MVLTRSRLAEIQSCGLPFCGFWVVGYFMGLSWNQVDHLYESGQLPKALCPDGSEYRPSGERLVLAERFATMLPEERRPYFDLWRKGAFQVESFASRDGEPPAFGSHQTGTVSPTAPLTANRSNAPDFRDARRRTHPGEGPLTVQLRNPPCDQGPTVGDR